MNRLDATDPAPAPGLSREHFSSFALRGFEDPWNAYPHSMTWFRDQLYIGTTRANLCMLKVSKLPTRLLHWPVDCPDDLYELDMRAQIWRCDPLTGQHTCCYRSPMIVGTQGGEIPRDMGYRGMAVFQGDSDTAPALYLATYASAKGPGPLILRSEDGERFEPVSAYGLIGLPITTIRALTAFKGRLITTPTGRAGGNPNFANLPIIYESRDPRRGNWTPINAPGFGDPTNLVVFELATAGDYLYAGTGNLDGFQLWRTRGEGNPPYHWEQVLTRGAYRGAQNQGVVSLQAFGDALYLGTGIQNGGIDLPHGVGPAAPELIRVHEDRSWDLIVGRARQTPRGMKRPLSGFGPGFNNPFNGYFWRMAAHDGWLYCGTFDWSLLLRYADRSGWPTWFGNLIERIGLERFIGQQAGAELYRTCDGENWLAVTNDGFDNPYNCGIRSLTSSPHGLWVGTANPFGPRVAVPSEDHWTYQANSRGGLELWLGQR